MDAQAVRQLLQRLRVPEDDPFADMLAALNYVERPEPMAQESAELAT